MLIILRKYYYKIRRIDVRKIILKGILFIYIICIFNICSVKESYAEDNNRITDFTSEPLHFVRPKLGNISIVSNQYKITWEYKGTCDGFIIYRKQNDGNWEQIAMLAGTLKDCYYDNNVDFNNEYSYTVSAYEYKDGNLVVSNYDDIGLRYLKVPIITSISKYNIKWQQSGNVDGYDICFSNNNGKLYVIGSVKKHTNFFSIGKYYKSEYVQFKKLIQFMIETGVT